jgi:hypothetical protein
MNGTQQAAAMAYDKPLDTPLSSFLPKDNQTNNKKRKRKEESTRRDRGQGRRRAREVYGTDFYFWGLFFGAVCVFR